MKFKHILIIIFFSLSKNTFAQKSNPNMKNKVPNSVEIVDSHLDNFFTDKDDIVVFDEIESEIIHRDVFFIKANDERPFHILLSCGMSALPMNIPNDINSSEFAEVMILLPKEWNLNYESFSDERNYWPVRVIKELMMLPHSEKTWLGFGHTFEFDDNNEFAEGVGFSSVMLVHSMELSEDFATIKKNDNKYIEIYTLIPLYKEELEYKKQNGVEALLEKFDEFGIEEIVKIGRKNVCK
ncbi:hypothetical protein CHRY9393_01050 [Chryseobacterium fistulae]|uniref:Suppressor of fused-like domain-containing protein n=2 Tax=Chryseobacterium fistulae TaxID=2675058 RepID=A0A6N4XTX6_9FLAO|nr:hypothetical protein CHRY9393_01050 [Chryseobacterium fistulae]